MFFSLYFDTECKIHITAMMYSFVKGKHTIKYIKHKSNGFVTLNVATSFFIKRKN